VPTAKQKNCEGCGKRFFASRSDTKFHSDRCRYKVRAENAKFETPHLPQSGVEGVTFARIRKRWEVRIKVAGTWKYIGLRKTATEAIAYQREVLNG